MNREAVWTRRGLIPKVAPLLSVIPLAQAAHAYSCIYLNLYSAKAAGSVSPPCVWVAAREERCWRAPREIRREQLAAGRRRRDCHPAFGRRRQNEQRIITTSGTGAV